jgi:hypothetical protein
MILLPSYRPNYLIYFFSVLIVVIGLKVGDLASKFGFDDSYYYLPLVYNMQS